MYSDADKYFFSLYQLGMGFLFKHFLKVVTDKEKFSKFDSTFKNNKNYFIQSDSLDTLLQISSFIVHKNVEISPINGIPLFKGYTYRDYKKLMDDMCRGECFEQYKNARDSEVLILYFPRENRDLTKIIECLIPIITHRDSEHYITVLLTTDVDLQKHFKFEDMTEDGRPVIINTGRDFKLSNVESSTKVVKTSKKVEQF